MGLILIPLGGVAIAQFFPFPKEIDPARLYPVDGPFAEAGWPGIIAWSAGAFVYWRFQATGSTLPALLVSFLIFAVWRRSVARAR